jgi:anti-sigma regulatory factor (Ser/Thr protein kinase)
VSALVGVPTNRQVRDGGLAVTPQAADDLTLAAVPSAVRCSRMFVRLRLRQWGLPSLAEDSELVISELVTNAVQAAGVADAKPRWSQLAALTTIHVRLLLFERSVVLAVWDRNPAAPVLKDSGTDSENGRGLPIVAALCERWDYLPVQDGKCVWAELAIQPDALASDGLPRRTPGLSATSAPEPGADLDLLRRVHQALKDL